VPAGRRPATLAVLTVVCAVAASGASAEFGHRLKPGPLAFMRTVTLPKTPVPKAVRAAFAEHRFLELRAGRSAFSPHMGRSRSGSPPIAAAAGARVSISRASGSGSHATGGSRSTELSAQRTLARSCFSAAPQSPPGVVWCSCFTTRAGSPFRPRTASSSSASPISASFGLHPVRLWWFEVIGRSRRSGFPTCTACNSC